MVEGYGFSKHIRGNIRSDFRIPPTVARRCDSESQESLRQRGSDLLTAIYPNPISAKTPLSCKVLIRCAARRRDLPSAPQYAIRTHPKSNLRFRVPHDCSSFLLDSSCHATRTYSRSTSRRNTRRMETDKVGPPSRTDANAMGLPEAVSGC